MPEAIGYCEHGVPWIYRCPNGDHEHHEHHECRTPRYAELDAAQRRIIDALRAAQEAAGRNKGAPTMILGSGSARHNRAGSGP